MAKIEMDVTEYDEMRKRSELAEKYAASLEETKKEISELHKQLQEKDKERIEELENSTKCVTYIKKETREEVILIRRDTRRTIEKLMEVAYVAHQAKYTGNEFGGHSYHDLHRNLEQRINEGIVDSFFEKAETRSYPVLEVVERKNLDEVISQIREEEKEALDLETKKKLRKLTEVSNEMSQWKKDYDDLKMENKALIKQISKYNDQELDNKRLQAKVFELNQTVHDAYAALFDANYFNAYKKVMEARPILRTQTEKKDGGNRDKGSSQ